MIERRHVLVVGASSGIGRAFAIHAARAGAKVVLVARRADRLGDAAMEAGGAHAVVGDVNDVDDCTRIVDSAVNTNGPIDLVFHAAGTAPLRAMAETTTAEWQSVLATNLLGVQSMISAAIPHLVTRGIVAVLSSETVSKPRVGLGAYGASKAALEHSLQSWRLEHDHVRFACLEVGATQPTEFGAAFDMSALGPAMEAWARHGLTQAEYMDTDAVADFFVTMLGAALAHPGIAVEHLTLRSPSPIVDGR
jgi:NAD(P)-dependent dehydrogenase (short-subunit alcohol dehydrogenase family)